MIDLHCHILPIDDGARNISESIELIKSAKKIGYKGLCCTSHYIVGKYENEKYEEKISELKLELKKQNIEIELFKGNELYLTPEGIKHLEIGRVNTIGGTNYLLVEIIPGMTFGALKISLSKIKKLGYLPILAHVERYEFTNEKRLKELKELGVIIQVNIRSLRTSEKIYKWIRLGLVDVLASDTHNLQYRNYDLEGILLELENKLGVEKRKMLTVVNPRKILENKEIEGTIYEKTTFTNNINGNTFFKYFFKRIKFRRSLNNSRKGKS